MFSHTYFTAQFQKTNTHMRGEQLGFMDSTASAWYFLGPGLDSQRIARVFFGKNEEQLLPTSKTTSLMGGSATPVILGTENTTCVTGWDHHYIRIWEAVIALKAVIAPRAMSTQLELAQGELPIDDFNNNKGESFGSRKILTFSNSWILQW